MKNISFAAMILLGGMLLVPEMGRGEEKEYPTKPNIFGFFQLDYYEGDAGDSTAVERTFFNRRTRLGISGALTEQLSYQWVGNFDGADSNATAASAQLLDAWVNFSLNPLLQVKAGQFKYTFDREGKDSGMTLPFATRPAIVNTLVGRLGQTGGLFRDIGLEIYGGQKKPIGWGYALGVINGNGTNLQDVNDHKDGYLRGTIEPIGNVSVGAGYYKGKNVFTRTAGTPPVTTVVKHDEQIWTVDTMLKVAPFVFVAAYYKGEYEPEAGADVEPKGWYALGSYSLLSNLDLLLRYQIENQDSNASEKKLRSTDIGVNYYMARKGVWSGTKVALNYMLRDADKSASSKVWDERGAAVTGEDVNNLFIARLQIPF